MLSDTIKKLDELEGKMSAFAHAVEILNYDGVTTAPEGTAANRARSIGILSGELYDLATGSEMREIIGELETEKENLDAKTARRLELLSKDMKELEKIPAEEYTEYQTLLCESDDVWHTAKKNSDFELFRPYLEKIFATEKKFAGYCRPDKKPYDYLLSKYEDGMTTDICDGFFETVRGGIVPLVAKISEKKQVDDSCIKGNFTVSEQEKFAYSLMRTIGLDMAKCGLATTEHPFTTSLGSHNDVRITTNYDECNFASSMFSVIHEGGHALYDGNSADDLAYTCLDGGVSMAVHESQSRFYENILGRSAAFAPYLFGKAAECFPSLRGYSWEQFYKAINKVEPSLIRTEADEVTYCLHVMIRYKLENAVISGDLEVKDLPHEWNRLYKEYLGVDVPDDRNGVLQDSHWAGGAVGYFPSYALGSAYGAQLLAKMKETVNVDECLKNGDFTQINEWNRGRIWKYGCLKKPVEVFEDAAEGKFDANYFIKYLEDKYSEIYEL